MLFPISVVAYCFYLILNYLLHNNLSLKIIERTLKVDYHDDWKGNKDKIISTTNSVNNTKPLNKKVDDMLYLSYNHFSLLYMIPDFKENRYESSSPDDTIIPITLYPNMSSLENTRVYQNMSSLAP